MMRLVSAFVRASVYVLGQVQPEAPAPVAPEPPTAVTAPAVDVSALLDLALVMRERWWPDAGFATDADKALAGAAMARCFPGDVVTVERCPCVPLSTFEPGEPKCDQCATDADMAALDRRLAIFLDEVERPEVDLAGYIPGEWVERGAVIGREIGERLRMFLPDATAHRSRSGKGIGHALFLADELAARRVGSDTKTCRWVGYLQALVVFEGFSTLEIEKARKLASGTR